MKKQHLFKPFSSDDIEFVSLHVDSFRKPLVLISGLIAIFEIVMIIRGLIIFDFSRPKHIIYFISYLILLLASLSTAMTIIYSNKFKNKKLILYSTEWIYSLVLFVWSLIISYIDMGNGNTPIVYLTIAIAVSGIVLLNPYIYNAILIPSFIALIFLCIFNQFTYLNSNGNVINVLIFLIMALIINYRMYTVTLSDYLEKNALAESLVTDSLTGLGNETKYLNKVRDIEEKISNGKETKFIIVMMDLNNLKATNDRYGHRYGCHLVVETGHILPTIFKNSDLFHIGGDEYVAIIDNENDYSNFDSIMKDFEDKLTYGWIEYSGVNLILSVAHGVGVYQGGMKYSDVLQIADDNMYQNKKELKEKYNFKGR